MITVTSSSYKLLRVFQMEKQYSLSIKSNSDELDTVSRYIEKIFPKDLKIQWTNTSLQPW